MVEDLVRPFRGGMTLLALPAHGPTMRLVGAMTVDAFSPELLVLRHARVTGVAAELGVRALQGKPEMLEIENRPVIVAMTVRAGRSQAAGMLIVRAVTANAIFRYRLLQIAAAVTVAATDVSMMSEEREAGFALVIKFLRGPAGR